jgi:hypothetical protein
VKVRLPYCGTTNCELTTIVNKKPENIIILDNEKETCMSIDVAIHGERNLIKKEAEKVLKYKDIKIKRYKDKNI